MDHTPGPATETVSWSVVAADLRDRVAHELAGRPVVLVTELLAGATRRIASLRDLGVTEVLVVTLGVGTGELPPDDVPRVLVTAPAPQSVTEQVTSWIRLAQQPPPEVHEAVQRFDPAGRALVLLGPFGGEDRFCDRESWGGRPATVAAWEDKTRADALFAAAGLTLAEHRVVPATPDDLVDAAGALDRGSGTVWSADASAGINGSADLVRWVRSPAEAADATAVLCQRARHVRIMPFLDGVPCSIHGFVLPPTTEPRDEDVAVFRPVEQIVLRSASSATFVYAGLSTYFDPSPADREDMRAAARAVGVELARTAGLRGGFSVDGVLSAEGFRPTEVNPRFSGGLGTIAKAVPELPIELVQQAAVRGVDLGVTAADLEGALVAAADWRRFGSAYVASRERDATETVSVPVTGDTDELAVAVASGQGGQGSRPAAGTLELGPSPLGALVRFTPTPGAVPIGGRLAPYAVAALRLADELWDTGFGPWEAAPDVRRGRRG